MKVAADGKKKFALLTTKPAGRVPTMAELTAGIDISCVVLDSDVEWSAAASDKFAEKPACTKGNSNAIGASNFNTKLTFLREWLAAGGADEAGADEGYQAVRVKGSEVHIYMRESDKDSTEPWEAGDIIDLGGRVVSDNPQRSGNEGNIKRRVEFEPQDMIIEEAIAAA